MSNIEDLITLTLPKSQMKLTLALVALGSVSVTGNEVLQDQALRVCRGLIKSNGLSTFAEMMDVIEDASKECIKDG